MAGSGTYPVRLIATDLDGTLLDSSSAVSPRTRAALDAARDAGVAVVPVTARQPIGLRVIAADAGFDGWALCGNGAYATHLTEGRMLFAEELPPATLRTLADALRASVPGLLFASTLSGAPFVEVMAQGVTKATGLARLCTHLGIDRFDVVAFGDALNDVEMLRWAGHGVAMAHAEPVVQEAADETAATNDEDGVARVIERLLGP